MIIGFPYYDGPGGARTWTKSFSNYCKDKGYDIVYGYDKDMDVYCSVATLTPLEGLRHIKERNIKILQRLGAIYIPYQIGEKLAGQRNQRLREIVSYADRVVYQSRFSKEVLFRSIYEGHEPNGEIIYNSTNPDLFRGKRNHYFKNMFYRSANQKKVILTIAYWGYPKAAEQSFNWLSEIIEGFEDRDDVEFWILGKGYPNNEELVRNKAFKNVVHLKLDEPVPYELIPRYLEEADVFLHLKFHEGCSNMVIESLHMGTPVVGIESGSLTELVGNGGRLVKCERNDILDFPKVKNMSDLITSINDVLENGTRYKREALKRSKKFSWENTYNRYLKLLEELYYSK